MRLPLSLFVVSTLVVELAASKWASGHIDGSNGLAVTSFFLVAAAYSYLRGEAALRLCKIDDANVSFCLIMIIAAAFGVIITILTASVSLAISYKTGLDVVLNAGIFNLYSFAHEQYPQIMLILTIMEVLACLLGGRTDVGRAIFNRISPLFSLSASSVDAAYSYKKGAY